MARSSHRLISLVALCLGGAASLACSSSDSGNNDGNGGAGGGGGGGNTAACTKSDLTVVFSPMYSSFIAGAGAPKFQIPVKVDGVSCGTVKFTADKKDLVDIQDDNSTGACAMITTLGAGTVTISATAGELCGSSVLNITEATQAQYDAGKARYNNGNALPTIMVGANGVPTGNLADYQKTLEENPPACSNCHGSTATSGFLKTVSHTPQQIGGFSDEELKAVITQAIIPDGGYYDEKIVPKQIWGYFHKWKATDTELEGLIVYIRGLTPESQGGKVDFQGFTPPGGMGSGGATGAGGTTSTGGSTASTGGASATGGAAASGGSSATGGAAATGGASASGGSSATGGASASGGAAP